MLRCELCGAEFETPRVRHASSPAPAEDGRRLRERLLCCPVCGGERLEEGDRCPLCGGWKPDAAALCRRCDAALTRRFGAFLAALAPAELQTLDDRTDGVSLTAFLPPRP